MKVFLTGAFGNIGSNTLIELLAQGHQVLCFDIRTPKTTKMMKTLSKKYSFKVYWGDILNFEDIKRAMDNIDVIIHLAAIIPPLSELEPQKARMINVEGTRNIIAGAKLLSPKPKLIYASTASIYGPTMHRAPPIKITDKINLTDNYTHSKYDAEELVRQSDLPWTIFRFAAVIPLTAMLKIDRLMFRVPLDQRIEFLHPRNAGTACVHAVTANTEGKILLIGGGKRCQYYQRDLVFSALQLAGVGKLPETAFIQPKSENDWFYVDWLDTEESEQLLKFQTLDFNAFLLEYKKLLGSKRYLARIFRVFVRRYILRISPYYKTQQTESK